MAAPFGTVVFDCDSTLAAIEGIEELAGAHREEIARLTTQAMDGGVALEVVYGRRLDLIRPSAEALARLGRRYIETLVPGAEAAIAALRAAGVAVKIVSGGLYPGVIVLGRHLGLADDDVAAVGIRFGADGVYAGFDAASPLARSGGKLEVLRAWAERLPRPILLVGDGATDLEARPAVDCFVAFTGVARRSAVAAAADLVIDGPSLLPVVDLALQGHVPSRSTP